MRQAREEVETANRALDQLISNLGYGTASAIENMYQSLRRTRRTQTADRIRPVVRPVLGRAVSCDIRAGAGLPADDQSFQIYEVDGRDHLERALTKAAKDRYNGAVNQVALRALHEVFESDRRFDPNNLRSGSTSTLALQPA